MATVSLPAKQRVLLPGINWHTYTALLRAFGEHHRVRLTYDRGMLEIMSPRFDHEIDADLLGRFVVVLTEELGLPIQAGGSTTLRRRRARRGLEADRCWWITSAPRMRGKRKLDLRIDPPPDLALEVDVTQSSLNRMTIYATLAVPEIWRLDSQGLTFHHLQADGKYAARDHSVAFPKLAPADLARFLALRAAQDENQVVRDFRAWVQKNITGGGKSPAAKP
jgi:Uma2 family endonuclease